MRISLERTLFKPEQEYARIRDAGCQLPDVCKMNKANGRKAVVYE